MAMDTKHEDLQSLRIDRSQRGDNSGEPPAWARRYIIVGIAIVVLLGLFALAYRAFSSDTPEVEVVRASAETSNSSDAGGTVLSATGYIVAHHTINVNSKVTGRLEWIGVEKGDKVKEGQVIGSAWSIRNSRHRTTRPEGAVENARAYLQELQHGSRPEEIQQAQHNLDEGRATLANDKLTLDRTKELAAGGVDLTAAARRRLRKIRGRPATREFPDARALRWRRSGRVPKNLSALKAHLRRRKDNWSTPSLNSMPPSFERLSPERFWIAPRKKAS